MATPNEPLALTGGPKAVEALHVQWPVIDEGDQQAVMNVLRRGVLSGHFAPEVRRLEQEFARYVGVRFAVATNSGTAALHIALAAAGVEAGDEVIVPAFTFVATALAVLHHNAIPVFVDIEPWTLGMDPALVEKAITPRTKAIIPVHLHGIPCDLAPIIEIATRRNLVLIEDAAQAHGAKYRGRRVGSFGAAGCFSLQSSKNLACGEGGLMVTDDEELYRRANAVRMFGEDVRPEDEASYDLTHPLDGNRAYDSKSMGWMYRTNEMSAALARSQLGKLESWNEAARRNARRLSERLAKLPGVTPPQVPQDREGVFHKYRVRFDASSAGIDAPPRLVRDALLAGLRAEGVEAVLWQSQPVPGQGLFQKQLGYGRRGNEARGCPWDHGAPVSYDLSQYRVTTRVLESSVCLFSQSYPIAPQPPELVDQYASAFEKVWGRLGEAVEHQRARSGAA